MDICGAVCLFSRVEPLLRGSALGVRGTLFQNTLVTGETPSKFTGNGVIDQGPLHTNYTRLSANLQAHGVHRRTPVEMGWLAKPLARSDGWEVA